MGFFVNAKQESFFLSLFSTRLKTLRGDAKQAEFARRIGLPQNSYSRYESGERVPDIDTLSQMASSLNVSSDWLLGLADDRTSRGHREKTPHANSTPPPIASPAIAIHEAASPYCPFCGQKDSTIASQAESIASLTRSLAVIVARLAPARFLRKPVAGAAGQHTVS